MNTFHRFIVASLFAATIAASAMAQAPGELDKRNGFKTIKLSMPVDSVRGSTMKKEFLEKDEFPAKLYVVNSPEYATVGEVNVRDIQLMTYKNLIYKIVVATDKDPRVMQALEKAFGKPVYVVRTGTYNWKGTNLSLTFSAHRNSIELTYRSYPVFRMMNEDKGKKVDAIAEDF